MTKTNFSPTLVYFRNTNVSYINYFQVNFQVAGIFSITVHFVRTEIDRCLYNFDYNGRNDISLIRFKLKENMTSGQSVLPSIFLNPF